MVDEEDKFLEVIVRRRGYLGETSFIGQSARLFSSVSTSRIGRPGRRTDGGGVEEKVESPSFEIRWFSQPEVVLELPWHESFNV